MCVHAIFKRRQLTINKRSNKYCKALVSPAVKLQHSEGFAFSCHVVIGRLEIKVCLQLNEHSR